MTHAHYLPFTKYPQREIIKNWAVISLKNTYSGEDIFEQLIYIFLQITTKKWNYCSSPAPLPKCCWNLGKANNVQTIRILYTTFPQKVPSKSLSLEWLLVIFHFTLVPSYSSHKWTDLGGTDFLVNVKFVAPYVKV